MNDYIQCRVKSDNTWERRNRCIKTWLSLITLWFISNYNNSFEPCILSPWFIREKSLVFKNHQTKSKFLRYYTCNHQSCTFMCNNLTHKFYKMRDSFNTYLRFSYRLFKMGHFISFFNQLCVNCSLTQNEKLLW